MSYFNNIFSGGDWIVFYKEAISQLSFFSYIWSPTNGNGFGQNIVFALGFKEYFAITTKFFSDFLNLHWSVTEKFIFFIPFWVFTFLSSFILGDKFFKTFLQRILVVIIYSFNTYSLMLIGGGQMGVALSYSLAPLVTVTFINLEHSVNIKKNICIAGLTFSTVFLLDQRIGIVSLFVPSIILIINNYKNIKQILSGILKYVLVIAISVLVNIFWILPFIFTKNTGLGLSDAYTNSSMVKFLSFATFENTISLLHPNWPENIFGKVGFMRSEFLLIPIIAYLALFFVKNNKKNIVAFSLIALIGAFLAKGTNYPFGEVYYWISNNIPLFTIFRDSTKWYLLIIISYSILIPFSIYEFTNKIKFNRYVALCIFLVFWIFTIRELAFGQLTGTFKSKTIPNEYLKLKSFILNNKSFYRTLWVPSVQRFGYFSNNNPAISSYDFYNTTIIDRVTGNIFKSEYLFRESSIRYIIVPYDSQGEIFLSDRKYDEKLYKQTVEEISSISWLRKIDGFGNIAVFEINSQAGGYKDHFWTTSDTLYIKYQYVSPVEYLLTFENAKKGDRVVFSENFDKNWTAHAVSGIGYQVSSIKYKNRFNSFVLQQSGDYVLKVYYEPQKWAIFGSWISGISLIIIAGYIFFGYLSKKW